MDASLADVVVRPARPSELRHLAAIEDAGAPLFVELFGDATSPVLLSPAPTGGDRDQEPGFLLVAVVGSGTGSTPVGFAHVTLPEGQAHLDQVSVLPAYGRRGIGARLVRAAMEEARWAGHDAMTLCTYRDVPWNGPFYARLGFVELQRLEPREQRLHDHELALGLDANGVRVVMRARLERHVTEG